MRKYPFILLSFLCISSILFFLPTNSTSQSNLSSSFKSAVEEQRKIAKRDIEQVKKIVEDLRRKIKENHWQFKVGITEAIKHEIEDITGLKTPSNLPQHAQVRSSEANKELSELAKKKASSHPASVQRGGFVFLIDEVDFYFTPPRKKEPQASDLEIKRNENRLVLGDEWDKVPTNERIPKKKEEVEIVDNKQPDTIPYVAPPQQEDNLPIGYMGDPNAPAFNWRDKKKVTPIRHQYTCGSCWAFTTIAILEASYKIQTNKEYDFSEQQIVDCAIDNAGRRAGSCNGGWYGAAFESLQRNGAVFENISPYKNRNGYCTGFSPSNYKIATWSYILPNAGTPHPIDIKKALVRYGPIATACKVTPAFQAYTGGVFDEHARLLNPSDVNHAVVIEGWDDTKGRGSWLLRNSWGKDWGENGYMWIEYQCNGIGFGAAWAVANTQQ
ncbi:MAG: C1 family peptidase [Spirochaetes bacterium]|nr:C1 family peptidase [Spirochaetota bacterium]